MAIYLLDKSLRVEVYFENSDQDYADNVCLSIVEECPENEKVFRFDETNLYLTPEQACELGNALLQAARSSQASCVEPKGAGDNS